MKALHLLAASAALSAALVFAAVEAGAQQRPVGGGPRITPPSQHGAGHGGFHGGVWVVEREVPVIIEREVVREVKVVEAPVAAPVPPRKPYVVGDSYSDLPGGCMKLIEDGASYYYCSGEWYRQMAGGTGKSAQYKAVAKP